MSLLRRIDNGSKRVQILRHLLAKLYPNEDQLKQEVEIILQNETSYDEDNKKSLEEKPIDFLLHFYPKPPSRPLRILLDKLDAEGQLVSHVTAILEEEEISLPRAEQAQIEANLIDYLMGKSSSPRRHHKPLLESNGDDSLKNKIIRVISDDDRLTFLTLQEDKPQIHEIVIEIFNTYLVENNIDLARSERRRLFDLIFAQLFGLDLLEPLLVDPEISEIRVIGTKNITVVRNGKFKEINARFDNYDHVLRIVDRIIAPLGVRIDETVPFGRFRLPDGSYISVTHPAISNSGPILKISKRSSHPYSSEDLIRFRTITPEASTFLKACVQAGCNIIISGMPDSGKTTLLSVLGHYIQTHDFIVTIEGTEELMLSNESIVSLHTRRPNIENRGAINLLQLLEHAQTLHPDRILIGEIEGEEVTELLRMPIPWITTLRARDGEDALTKLEPLYLIGDEKRPIQAVRSRIGEAVDIVVHVERLLDGTRRVMYISEVSYSDDDTYSVHNIFRYERVKDIEKPHIPGYLNLVSRPTQYLYQRLTEFPVDQALSQQMEELFTNS